ncbi:MAG: chemotaxis protein chel [Pseudomonadota bacterium]
MPTLSPVGALAATPRGPVDAAPRNAEAGLDRTTAQAFEAAFLAEMFRHAGLARPRTQFGGGAGEAQFAPMLARLYAEQIAEARPLGIAEAAFGAGAGGDAARAAPAATLSFVPPGPRTGGR